MENYFSQFGAIEKFSYCTDRKLKDVRATLSINSKRCVRKIISQPYHWVSGNQLRAKLQTSNAELSEQDSCKIFIGGLNKEIMEGSLVTQMTWPTISLFMGASKLAILCIIRITREIEVARQFRLCILDV
jgi:hypothetical protein